MKPELSIKLGYLEGRRSPAELFEAMALYINAYRDLGQLLTNSVGIRADFEFQLNGIEKSSILSKLSSLPGKIDTILEAAFYNSGNDLFKELTGVGKTESEEQVEKLATSLETSLAHNLPQQIADPYVERKALASVLDKFSRAHEKIQAGEIVEFCASGTNGESCRINTGWRFTGDLKEMFQGESESKEFEDKLYVKVTVNEGQAVWTFRSISLKRTFSARIVAKDWLKRYQDGLIPPIGPKDIIEASVSLEFYTPPQSKGQPEIRNAKINSIGSIIRHSAHQFEITNAD